MAPIKKEIIVNLSITESFQMWLLSQRVCFFVCFFFQCWVHVPQLRQEGVTPSTRALLSVWWLLETAWQTAPAKKRMRTRSTPSAGQWERHDCSRCVALDMHANSDASFSSSWPHKAACSNKKKKTNKHSFLNPVGNDNDYSGEMVYKKKEQSSLGEAAVLGIHCALIQRA